MLHIDDRNEIISAVRHEFQTFKDDAFKPIADTVKENTDKTAEQGEHIARNSGDIKTLKGDVKENRGSINHLPYWILGSLVTILAAVIMAWVNG